MAIDPVPIDPEQLTPSQLTPCPATLSVGRVMVGRVTPIWPAWQKSFTGSRWPSSQAHATLERPRRAKPETGIWPPQSKVSKNRLPEPGSQTCSCASAGPRSSICLTSVRNCARRRPGWPSTSCAACRRHGTKSSPTSAMKHGCSPVRSANPLATPSRWNSRRRWRRRSRTPTPLTLCGPGGSRPACGTRVSG